jgi:hypothetical protein
MRLMTRSVLNSIGLIPHPRPLGGRLLFLDPFWMLRVYRAFTTAPDVTPLGLMPSSSLASYGCPQPCFL